MEEHLFPSILFFFSFFVMITYLTLILKVYTDFHYDCPKVSLDIVFVCGTRTLHCFGYISCGTICFNSYKWIFCD